MAKHSLLKINFIYSYGYHILVLLLPLVTAPYVSRVLGADNLGIFSKTQAVAHYFLLFAMLGVGKYGNRAIARARDCPQELSKVFWEIYAFQFIMACVCTLSYLICCCAFSWENALIYLIQIGHVISAMANINWCCMGLEKLRLIFVRNTIIKLLAAIAVFTLVKGRGDLWLYTLIVSLATILSDLAVWPFILKRIFWVRPTWDGIRRHIKPNLLLFWSVIAVSIYNVMDRIMLGWFSTDAEVGYYTYAERVVRIPNTLMLALDGVVMPRMSNLFAKQGKEGRISYLMDTVMLFAMFMAGGMAFGMAGSANVFAPWFFGKTFTRCGYFIVLLCPIIVVKGWAAALRTQFLIPSGRDKIYVFSITAGAFFNVIFNALLIPRWEGVGAIVGTIAAEVAVCVIQFWCCRKDIPLWKYLFDGIIFSILGFVMYLVIIPISRLSFSALPTLVLQVASGSVIYLAMSCWVMIYVIKNPILINQALQFVGIKYRFARI